MLSSSFAVQKFFCLKQWHLSLFALVSWTFGIISKIFLPRPISRMFPYIFVIFFTLLGYELESLIYFKIFFLAVLEFELRALCLLGRYLSHSANPKFIFYILQIKELILFCMWIPSFPNSNYWRHYPFSNVCSWHLCWRSIDYKNVDLFLSSPVCSIGVYICFDCYSFVIQFEIR
jgi:hypothetical protein